MVAECIPGCPDDASFKQALLPYLRLRKARLARPEREVDSPDLVKSTS